MIVDKYGNPFRDNNSYGGISPKQFQLTMDKFNSLEDTYLSRFVSGIVDSLGKRIFSDKNKPPEKITFRRYPKRVDE